MAQWTIKKDDGKTAKDRKPTGFLSRRTNVNFECLDFVWRQAIGLCNHRNDVDHVLSNHIRKEESVNNAVLHGTQGRFDSRKQERGIMATAWAYLQGLHGRDIQLAQSVGFKCTGMETEDDEPSFHKRRPDYNGGHWCSNPWLLTRGRLAR